MLNDYSDITSRIAEPPKWYGELGEPRYCDFNPWACGVYADEVALLLIACQACGREFNVSIEFNLTQAQLRAYREGRSQGPVETLGERLSAIRDIDTSVKHGFWDVPHLNYGDPPRHDCIGDTMSSDTLAVVEFHRRPRSDFERVPELEFRLPVFSYDDWGDDVTTLIEGESSK